MADVPYHECGPGRSFFAFIAQYWKGTRAPQNSAFHRVCTLMRKLGARTAIVEDLDSSCDEWPRVSREIEAVARRVDHTICSREARKFTFVTVSIQSDEELADLPETAFLGYATLFNVEIDQGLFLSYIFESIIREPGTIGTEQGARWEPLLNNYLHVKRTFSCRTRGRTYEVPGSFFCQQNTVTSVCAHACTVMVLNSILPGDQLVSCEDVNDILGVDHTNDRLQTDWAENVGANRPGLSAKEMETVFRHFGYTPYYADFRGEKRRHWREFLYGFIESGYPATLIFQAGKDRHVVPLFGHTLNSDSWFPPAFAGYASSLLGDRPYISSLDWVADFLGHDDNFGMYFCLPGHSFRPEGHADPGAIFEPLEGIGLLPVNIPVESQAYRAQDIAFLRLAQILEAAGNSPVFQTQYMRHLIDRFDRRAAVLRTCLVSVGAYLKHLSEPDNQGNAFSAEEKGPIAAHLDGVEHAWLVEVTEPDLYVGNKSKVVDVLIDPLLKLDDVDGMPNNYGVMLIRVPGHVIVPQDNGYAVAATTRVEGHAPLFALDSGRPPRSTW